MAQLPPWTEEISDRLMDIQVIAQRMIDEDGVRTQTEQALLDAMIGTQEIITEVESEINAYTTTVRTGQRPRRVLRAIEPTLPDAA